MASPTQLLIIDGYNLLHQSGHDSQDRLVADIRALQGSLAEQTVVVFDGNQSSVQHEPESPAFSIVYSRRNQSADALIESMVQKHPAPESVMVVSSDAAIATLAGATGCQVESSRTFAERLLSSRNQIGHQLNRGRSSGGANLGDFFPDS